jgi:glucokinase
MTLDAGGTNFVFTAIRGNEEIVNPIHLPSNAHDLDLCLDTIIEGFSQLRAQVDGAPAAISFAFPGPADYPNGIIFDLQNLPAFRGGVALGPMLSEYFGVPVYINNDGDLYAYGEALSGFLPYINGLLKKEGSPRTFKNLFGITLGTGFGGGLVREGRLFLGDNSAASEVWLLRNKLHPETYAEEGVSIRAAQRVYAKITGISMQEAPSPKEIYEIGIGERPGEKEAAIEAYRQMGEVLGEAIGTIVNIMDGIIVIGGGIAGAKALILPAMMQELRSAYTNQNGEQYNRLVQAPFNLENEYELKQFLTGNTKKVKIPRTDKTIEYDPMARIGVGFTKLGASKSIALGAYAYALNMLDN